MRRLSNTLCPCDISCLILGVGGCCSEGPAVFGGSAAGSDLTISSFFALGFFLGLVTRDLSGFVLFLR